MKLLIQSKDIGDVGGIARYIESFLDNLPESVQVILLCPEGRKLSTNPRIESIPIAYSESKVSKLLWGLRCRSKIRGLCEAEKIDHIIIHIPPLLPALFLDHSIRYNLTAHTTYKGETGYFLGRLVKFKQTRCWLERRIRFFLEKQIFKKAARIITLTEQGKQELLSYDIDEPKIVVIPNGVDIVAFKPSYHRKKDIDVLFIGRLTPRKGSRSLVTLCQLLLRKNPKIHIVVIGFGEDQDFVRSSLKAAIEQGTVEFTGKLPPKAVLGYYHRAKVYCSTSYYEGLPGTCLEAMACGVPPVVWDMDFYEGLVLHGVNGILIPPNEYQQMTTAILRLLSDKKETRTLGRNARQKVLDEYSWKKLAKKIVTSTVHI
jgi:glycosyltransferase involved in cell wall biosynthesis